MAQSVVPKLLGIDVGTTACKAVLIDETGRVLKQASAEYPLHVPRALWAEQNPIDWWHGVQKCLGEIVEQPNAIGLTGQMHGAVFLDHGDNVIRPAILWNDQRTRHECDEIEGQIGAESLRKITLNPMLPGFQLPKLIWLRNYETSRYQQVRSMLLPKDYIRLKLSGAKATDVSDASGTGCFSVGNRAWSHEILSGLEVSPDLLPPVFESSEVTATTDEGIPIVAGAGDQAAAAVGTGAVKPGVVSMSLGTSGVVFTSLDQPREDPSGGAHVFCHANRAWHAMGVMLSCGGAIRWFRDTLAPDLTYDELAEEASSVDSEGLTFLPYLAGERSPINDSDARGAWVGLTLAHGRAHMARAVFEGVTFGLKHNLDHLRTMGVAPREIRATGGGAKSTFWLQMLADVLEIPVVTMEVDEGPAFGAAILAGVGIGVWQSVEQACDHVVKTSRTIHPSGVSPASNYQRYLNLYPALHDAH